MPNQLISFRLTPDDVALLQEFKRSGESDSLAVKRLLLSVITPQSSSVSSSESVASHQLNDVSYQSSLRSHHLLEEAVINSQHLSSDVWKQIDGRFTLLMGGMERRLQRLEARTFDLRLLAPYLEKVNQQLAELSEHPVEKPTQPMTPVEVDEEKDWQYPQPQIHTDYEDYRDDTTEVELTEDSENLEEKSRQDDQEDTQNQVKDESSLVIETRVEEASIPAFKDGLNQAALARHLDVSDSTVLRNRVKSEEAKDDSIFANWSQKKDPDHIAWRYSKQNEKYYPMG